MQTKRIHVLPDVLANQIAAGEVIERPASVVKELLENSLDAGATDVLIEIEDGGTRYICVRDNGCGIHPEDLGLAVRSHATSKIRDQEDLQHILTLGFRGEALSSIAAVSQFRMTSCSQDAERAWQVRLEQGDGSSELLPASHPPGTTVEVRNLFHTVPARKKFLRSERTEFLHIQEIVRRIALSRFHVKVRFIHNGKQVLLYKPGNDDDSLIGSIMGRKFLNRSHKLEFSSDNMRLWGWLGTPEHSRNQTDRQYFYLNGRIIRDKQINHAIRMAYSDELSTGRYPTYVLYLEIDAGAADINVHPTKYEVRFRNARDVHDFIYTSLKKVLESDAGNVDVMKQGVFDQTGNKTPDQVNEVRHFYRNLGSHATEDTTASAVPELGRPLTCLYGRFIITRRNDSFLLIDYVQARCNYIEFRMKSADHRKPLTNRPLLVPVSINFPPEQADHLEKLFPLISIYGLGLDRNTADSIIVRFIPALLPNIAIREVLHDILTAINQTEDEQAVRQKLIRVISSHAIDGVGNEISWGDMENTLHALEATDIDTGSPSCQGIWTTLHVDELVSLLTTR